MAKIKIDGQYIDIRTSFNGKEGEYTKYIGNTVINGKSAALECIQTE
jgi:hypothetical protein